MSATIIEFQPRAKPAEKPARLASARAALGIMGAVFPLLELAYYALDRGDLATARAALAELCEEPLLTDMPAAAIEWRAQQVELLKSTIRNAANGWDSAPMLRAPTVEFPERAEAEGPAV